MEDLEKRARELAEAEMAEKEHQLAIKEETGNKLVQAGQDGAGIDFASLNKKFLEKQIEDGKDLTQISRDFAKAQATHSILNDTSEQAQKYRQELVEEQKETLKESFVQDKVIQQKETLDAKQKRAEAFYKSVRPILEFDFSNLIRDEKYTSRPQKNYEDRSYGIFLMVCMLIVLTVPYFMVSFLLAILNGLNSMFCQIATFGSIAKVIALSLLLIGLAAIALYCVLLGVENVFGVQIFPHL